jgi:predicted dehydrogenase
MKGDEGRCLVNQQGEDTVAKVRWGLIGCGDISRKRVAPALADLPQADLVAVNRARSELLGTFASEFGTRRTYQNWRELLKDDEIDAVYVATPVDLHAPMTIAAACSGKHVLCEKPMALSLEECDCMIQACRENAVHLGIAYYRHFYPVIQRTKQLISSGELGKVVLLQLNAFEYFNPSPGDPRHWFIEKNRAGGGPMFDFGCHRIQVLLDIVGTVQKVKAFFGRIVFEREVEDTATAILRCEGEIQATITISHGAFEAQDTLSIFGSRGSIHVPVLNRGTMKIVTEKGEREETHPASPNFHEPLIKDFCEAIMRNRSPQVDGKLGREVNRILSDLYRDGNS